MLEWQQFGPVHLISLGLTAILCFNVVFFRRDLRRVRLDIWLTASMAALQLAWTIFCLATQYKDIGHLLPLYTCDATVFAAAAWCVTRRRWLGQLVIVWSVLGGVITLLFPDTDGFTFPNFVAVYTVLFHALMLILAFELWTVERVGPSWSALAPVALASLALIPPSLAANAAFGSDYMFVSSRPQGVFGFLGDFDGALRIGLTMAAGATLLVLTLLAWFAAERLLNRTERETEPEPEPIRAHAELHDSLAG